MLQKVRKQGIRFDMREHWHLSILSVTCIKCIGIIHNVKYLQVDLKLSDA